MLSKRRTKVSNVVTLPIEDYKAITGFAKRCQDYAQECTSRVKLYEQYEVTATGQLEELTKYSAQLEAEKQSRPGTWTVIGWSLLAGALLGVGGVSYAR